MSRPDDSKLTRDYLRDLVVDIRCARRDGLDDYAKHQAVAFQLLWPRRHEARIGRYGIPQ